jgi:hypothetical protein
MSTKDCLRVIAADAGFAGVGSLTPGLDHS